MSGIGNAKWRTAEGRTRSPTIGRLGWKTAKIAGKI
jgi:hypothetical protein